MHPTSMTITKNEAEWLLQRLLQGHTLASLLGLTSDQVSALCHIARWASTVNLHQAAWILWKGCVALSSTPENLLALGHAALAIGECAFAAEVSQCVLNSQAISPTLHAEACILCARSLIRQGALEEALTKLQSLPPHAPPQLQKLASLMKTSILKRLEKPD
ncbi:MAG: hypothetical protein N2515_11500, partial [Deltaproteobacteria bacterium]|nr:hypothetical protein [Deltaproteobacteria bacterium]